MKRKPEKNDKRGQKSRIKGYLEEKKRKLEKGMIKEGGKMKKVSKIKKKELEVKKGRKNRKEREGKEKGKDIKKRD